MATLFWVVFHGDVEVDANEDAAAWDGIGEVGIVDEELVCERHGRRWEQVQRSDQCEFNIWMMMCVGMHRLMADSNSLGLDFEKETATEETRTEEEGADTPEEETRVEKKKPYVNLERVKTGGPQRVGAVLLLCVLD